MGLLQQAVKTYDLFSSMGLVGKYEEGKEPLAPIGHLLTTAHILITINKNGEFISAERLDKKIIIPVTEESAGRTSSAIPHPLNDNIGYLSGEDEEKINKYLEFISKWAESDYSDIQLNSIIMYLKRKTLIQDLEKTGLLKFDETGKIKNNKELVTWKIIGLENKHVPVFEDVDLMKKYSDYYLTIKNENESNDYICYVSGEKGVPANQHLKGVFSLNGNAKIISSNDSVNYTYRGRFINSDEALSVGYISSQKAHNALKWLVSNQKQYYGNRVFICWNPNGKEVHSVQSPLLKRSSERLLFPSDYKNELAQVLEGLKKEISDVDDVIICSFDAATTGRLSISYYNELKESDFLDRLYAWDATCCWISSKYGVYSPGLYDIVLFSFGTQRGNDENSKVEVDDLLKAQYIQRLICCRVDQANIPQDILIRLVNNAHNLQIYNKVNRNKLLFITCAVIRKYHYDYLKEECIMSLEKDKNDRSYQFGRLLAVLEKIEKDTYDNGESRETNAIRMQSVYVKRPLYAFRIIIEQLKNSYFPKLNPGRRVYYDKLISQIMDKISEFKDEEINKALSDTYLLGYYLQQADLYTKKDDNDKED